MTDPVTNVEIEDVLSSIRRLVSEKGRADAPVDAAPRAAAPTDRLVLTPALRVAEPVDEAEEDKGDTDTEELVAEDLSVAEDVLPEDTEPAVREDWAEHSEAVVLEPEAEIEVEAEDETAQEPEIEAVEAEVAEVLEEVAEEEARLEDDELPEPELVTGVAPGALSADLESRIAKWEAVVATADESYEPARAGEDDYAGTEVESLPWQDHSDPVTEYQGDIRSHAPQAAEPQDYPEAVEEADEHEELRAEEMVVEAVADDVTEQVQGGMDEALLDEDALRELVGEIVRQELQGALGERITRNVRKLVRREIHRALSASGLD